jgi:hypothetical protein
LRKARVGARDPRGWPGEAHVDAVVTEERLEDCGRRAAVARMP